MGAAMRSIAASTKITASRCPQTCRWLRQPPFPKRISRSGTTCSCAPVSTPVKHYSYMVGPAVLARQPFNWRRQAARPSSQRQVRTKSAISVRTWVPTTHSITGPATGNKGSENSPGAKASTLFSTWSPDLTCRKTLTCWAATDATSSSRS